MFNLSTQDVVLSIENAPLVNLDGIYFQEYQNFFGNNFSFPDISKSKFTLAPWGNGIDTHRFWEAIYLGSIPITLKHTHYEKFSKLPAIFLNNYSELTIDNLEKQSQNFKPSDIQILDINYWFKMIKSENIEKTNFKIINFVNSLNLKIRYFKLKIKIKSQKKIIIYYIKNFLNLKNYYRIFVN